MYSHNDFVMLASRMTIKERFATILLLADSAMLSVLLACLVKRMFRKEVRQFKSYSSRYAASRLASRMAFKDGFSAILLREEYTGAMQ